MKGLITVSELPEPWVSQLYNELLDLGLSELSISFTRLWWSLWQVETQGPLILYIEQICRKYNRRIKWL